MRRQGERPELIRWRLCGTISPLPSWPSAPLPSAGHASEDLRHRASSAWVAKRLRFRRKDSKISWNSFSSGIWPESSRPARMSAFMCPPARPSFSSSINPSTLSVMVVESVGAVVSSTKTTLPAADRGAWNARVSPAGVWINNSTCPIIVINQLTAPNRFWLIRAAVVAGASVRIIHRAANAAVESACLRA